MDKEKEYIALIGDIIQSKQETKRANIQLKLEKALKKINLEFAEDISANFMITLGDEFQGLLHNSENIINIITEIEKNIYPVQIRFGIGIGDIATASIERYIPLGTDGPAYHYAREMVEDLKVIANKKKVAKSNIAIRSNYPAFDQLLNALFAQLYFQKSNWSSRQYQIVNSYLLHQRQTSVAKELNITQPTVQKSLVATGYYNYVNSLKTAQKTLNSIVGGLYDK